MRHRVTPLCAADLAASPLRQFEAWFAEARAAGVAQAEAVALATADAAGRPSARMVLLKGADEDGFVFFTNLESRKGEELAANPYAALCFFWQPLGRQVRVEGPVSQVPAAESDAYFASRPPGSQLSATVSPQSRPVEGRAELEAAVERLRAGLAGAPPPRPASWGGYRLAPEAYEFWQHRDDRLHDRFRYRWPGDWLIERLAP